MSWVSIGKMSSKPTIEKGRVSLELVDIPPFEEEEYSVPEETLRTSVDLFYVSGKVVDNNEFWKLESEDWQSGRRGLSRQARQAHRGGPGGRRRRVRPHGEAPDGSTPRPRVSAT